MFISYAPLRVTRRAVMNADRLIKMIINRVLRTLVNKGVDGTIKAVSGGKKGKQRGGGANQTKQAMRMMRRAGRM